MACVPLRAKYLSQLGSFLIPKSVLVPPVTGKMPCRQHRWPYQVTESFKKLVQGLGALTWLYPPTHTHTTSFLTPPRHCALVGGSREGSTWFRGALQGVSRGDQPRVLSCISATIVLMDSVHGLGSGQLKTGHCSPVGCQPHLRLLGCQWFTTTHSAFPKE